MQKEEERPYSIPQRNRNGIQKNGEREKKFKEETIKYKEYEFQMGKKCHWLTMAYGLKNDDGADDDDCYRFWRALFRKIICTRRRIPYGPDVNCFRLRPYLNAVEISSKKVWHGNEWPQ